MPQPEPWRLRARTLRATVLLLAAKIAVGWIPLKTWRSRLGLTGPVVPNGLSRAHREAAHIERAAWRLPIGTACLPRAVALSWRLRSTGIAHQVTLAIRPVDQRDGEDALHAWVEVDGETVLGALPGPWHVTARFPA